MFAAVGKDLAHSAVAFLQDNDYARRLNELIGEWQQAAEGNTGRQTAGGGIPRAEVLHAVSRDFGSLGPERSILGFEVREDAENILRDGADVVAGNAENVEAWPE